MTGTWSLSIIPYWQGPYDIVFGVYFTLGLDWLAKINDRLICLFLNLSTLCPISWPPLFLHNWVQIYVDKTCSADQKVDLKANINMRKLLQHFFLLNLSPLCPISWPPLFLHNWVSICVDKTCSADHKVDLKGNIYMRKWLPHFFLFPEAPK